jgi:hypothetical protein
MSEERGWGSQWESTVGDDVITEASALPWGRLAPSSVIDVYTENLQLTGGSVEDNEGLQQIFGLIRCYVDAIEANTSGIAPSNSSLPKDPPHPPQTIAQRRTPLRRHVCQVRVPCS